MFESRSPVPKHKPRAMSEAVRLGEILPAVLRDIENRMLDANEKHQFRKRSAMVTGR